MNLANSAAEYARSHLEDENTSAVDVVEYVVRLLEDEPLFNAGRGAVLTRDGTHELEASIMDGRTGQGGAARLLKSIKNPISLARGIMIGTPHICLAGAAAEQFAGPLLCAGSLYLCGEMLSLLTPGTEFETSLQ